MVPNEGGEMGSGMLAVRRAEDGDRLVLCLCGELDLSNADQAEREIGAALSEPWGEIVVDLQELSFIDSTGISLLVRSFQRKEAGGRLQFIPSPFAGVRRVMELTGLEGKLPTADYPGGPASPASPADDDPIRAS